MQSKENNQNLVLQVVGVSKDFPGVKALDCVNFEAHTGEVHAVVGANGAGKSTLSKIIAGIYSLDVGQILINGSEVRIGNPLQAKAHGIAMTPQEVDVALVPNLTVAENIMLDHLARQSEAFVNWAGIRSEAERLAAEVGLECGVNVQVSQLSIHQRQKVAIAQTLQAKTRFLILDEPTASLSLREVDELFALIRDLVKRLNLCIIYISHRMPEVFSIADRITVMRDGQVVGTVNTKESSIDQIVFMMLNRRREAIRRITRANPPGLDGEMMLKAEHLNRGRMVRDVSLQVREREVVALTGLVGAGKTETSRVLFGADRLESGTISVRGKVVHLRQPADAVRLGLSLVPEDRRQQGVLTEFPIAQNISLPSLPSFSPGGFLRPDRESEAATGVIERLQIKCMDCAQQVKFLSGGNQQKVAIGKWLVASGKVFIFDEPTKGVDVGAKEEIFRIIGTLADAGAAVILSSAEFEEVLRVSDRILVMYDGRIVAELDGATATEEQILRYASGGGN